MENDESIERIELWVKKFKSSLSEQIPAILEANPELSEQEAKEMWFLNKLATLMVGSELLGNQVRELEAKSK